jgi:hypothetical protein
MKGLLKFLVAAATGASAMVAMSAAHAATYPLGTVSPGIGQVVENVGTGPFTDQFTFTVNQDSAVGGEVDNLPLDLTFHSFLQHVLNITGLSLSLVGPSGVLASAAGGSSLAYADLFTGVNYSLIASGTGTGSAGGTYAIAYNVSSVPVPPTLPLFGAGLLGLGVYAWGKRRALRDS